MKPPKGWRIIGYDHGQRKPIIAPAWWRLGQRPRKVLKEQPK